MQSPKIFADKIFYYENVLSNPQQIIDILETTDDILSDQSLISQWKTWHASDDSSYIFGAKKSTNPLSTGVLLSSIIDVYNSITSVFSEYSEDYAKTMSVEIGKQAPISISKYFAGSSMGKHTDSGPNPTRETISAVLYLNDDCVGGEISFPEQGVTIKPSAGSLVIFPSVPPFYHESLEVKNGTKYMSPAFWHLSV